MGILRAGFHGTVGQPSAQVIDGSLKFDSSVTNYLKKTPTVAGNRRTFTISFWVKRNEGSANEPGILSTYDGVSGPAFTCYFNSSDKLRVYDDNSGYRLNLITTQVFRDYNSWYHIVISIDTTASDKAKLYVNGVRVTEFSTELYPGDINLDWNTATAHNIGRHVNAYDGNISNFYSIDGQVLGPEYFGFTDPLTNTWRPKKFEGPTSPNDGTTWSSNLTVSGGTYTIQNPGYAFDNDSYDTYADASGTGNAVYTFSPSSTIRANSSVRVFAYAANGQDSNHIKITYNNGVEVTKTAADLGLGTPGDHVWFDLSSYINFPADISSIEYSSIGGGGRISAIEIDGILLIDGLNDPKGFGTNGFYLPFDGNSAISQDKSSRGNDWTPINFGSSNTIDKATGALPILNTINGGNTATVGVRTDATVAAGVGTCVLAIPFGPTATDVSNQINSESSTKTVAIDANIQLRDSPGSNPIFYGSTHFFGSWAQQYDVEIAANADFDFGNSPWTIETWCFSGDHTTTNNYQTLWSVHTGGMNDFQNPGWLSLLKDSTGGILVAWGITAGYDEFYAANAIPTSKWTHVALCWNPSNSRLKLFIDGNSHPIAYPTTATPTTAGITTTITQWGSSTKAFHIGDQGYTSTPRPWNGYIHDFRIYKGVEKYTENFVPASIDPDILPDTPSGVSGSSELAKITDGAVIFDGNGLSIADSADFTFGSGDFTMEAFVYCNDASTIAHKSIVNKYTTNNASSSWFWSIYNGYQYFYFYYGNLAVVPAATTLFPFPSKKWVHCAIVRDGNTLRMFQDGIQVDNGGDVTDLTINDTSVALTIGEDRDNNYPMDGYISNVRIVKGTALYTSNFTPPTKPLTNVTNTTLLCCQSTTDVTEGAVKPADVSWMPTGYTYWSGMNDNWDVSGTTTSDISGTGDGDWIATSLPTSGKYYFETIVNNPGQYRVIGFAIGQSGAGANYLDNMFGYYFNGTGTPPLFLTKNSSGTNRSSEAQGSGFYHGNTSELTLHDGDILMWGWDADNDKIYFGLNGTWYNNGDPVEGSGHIVSGEDLSASSFYLKVGYMNSGGHSLNKLSLTNVPSNESGSSSSIVSSREISNFNLLNKASNFNPFNTDTNTVRGQETGYPTWNPLRVSGQTLSNNNMTTTGNSGNVLGSMFTPTSGKFYWEVTAGSNYTMTGIQREDNYYMGYPGHTNGQIALYLNNGMGSGQLYEAGSITSNWGGGLAGDVIGVALDMDNNKVYFYNNGIGLGPGGLTGTPIAVDVPTGGGYTANCRSGSGTSDGPSTINFGQTPFKFQPPDGFQPLNAANIRPETVISRPDQYVGIVTYTGNGTTGQSIKGLNFDSVPDLVWIKSRTTADHHHLFDTVRGPNNILKSSNDGTEDSSKAVMPSFDFNGFSVDEVVGNSATNNNTHSFVAWCWKAGGDSNTYNVDGVGYANASDVNMSAGALNSISYDQSQTWSNLDTYPTSYSPTTPANLFNGVVSTGEADFWYSAGASTVRFDNLVDQLPEIVNTIELYVYDRSGTMIVTVNGVGANNYANTGTYKWIKLTPNKKIVTLTVSGTDSVYWGIGAIKINGVMLANAGVTPANVPSIAPTGCSVGTKQGFSIIQYQGNGSANQTISHGLTQAPDFSIFKNMDGISNWTVYHNKATVGIQSVFYLNTTADIADYSGGDSTWWGTLPDASVFTIGATSTAINNGTNDIISYHWHNVPGLQKFGTYEGIGGTADGAFVELGFRPAIVWVKSIDNGNGNSHWCVFDNLRPGYNKSPAQNRLHLDENVAEDPDRVDDGQGIDILSNGFRVRSNNWYETNASGETYIYCAWAEAPSVNLYGGSSNAR